MAQIMRLGACIVWLSYLHSYFLSFTFYVLIIIYYLFIYLFIINCKYQLYIYIKS